MNNRLLLSIVLFAAFFLVLVSAASYNSNTWKNGNPDSDSGDLRYDINLAKGWNLVPAFYKINRIAESSQIKESDIKVIYAYLPNKSKYARLYPEDASSNQDFLDSPYQKNTVIPHSFWVYSEKSGVLEFIVYGQKKDVFDSISLGSGWNFLGINRHMAGKKLRDIIGNCDISKVYLWNNYEYVKQQDGSVLVDYITPEWKSINIDTVFDNDAWWMRGIIVKVTNDCNLGVSGDVLGLPPLPESGDTNSPVNQNPTSTFDFPQTIGTYSLISSEHLDEGCVENLCFVADMAEYRDSNKRTKIALQDITSGTEAQYKEIAANSNGGTLETITIGNDKLYRLENHELFWFTGKDNPEVVFTQEGTVTTNANGETFSYGIATGDNAVTKKFLSLYPSKEVD